MEIRGLVKHTGVYDTLSKRTLTWVEVALQPVSCVCLRRQLLWVDDWVMEWVTGFLERPDWVAPEAIVRADLSSVQRLLECHQILRRYCNQ